MLIALNGIANIMPGSFVYLSNGSRHTLEIFTDEFSFSGVNFTMMDCNHEHIVFSQTPILICKHQNRPVINTLHKLNDLFSDAGSDFKCQSLFYELFDIIKKLSDFGEKTTFRL